MTMTTGPTTPRKAHTIEAAERIADLRNCVPQRPIDPDDREAWRLHAACGRSRVDPEIFHPLSDIGVQAVIVRAAQAICAQCPVMAACRDARYKQGATGVWAGVYYGADAAVRMCANQTCDKPTANAAVRHCGFEHAHAEVVGTRRGYDLHRREGEAACAPCDEGHRKSLMKYDRRPSAAVNNRGAGGGRHRGAGRM